jgi:hypothetical protein
MAPEFDRRMIMERQKRVLKNAWYASASTLIIYLLLPHFILASHRLPVATNVSARLRMVLWVVAFIELVVLLWWKRFMLSPERLIAAANNRPTVALAHYLGKSAAAFAMANSIAVYGLALALIGSYFLDQYVLTLMALILLADLYPSSDTWQQIARTKSLRGD